MSFFFKFVILLLVYCFTHINAIPSIVELTPPHQKLYVSKQLSQGKSK